MASSPGQVGANGTAGGVRQPRGSARPSKLSVALCVTAYCAVAWGLAFAGIGAGWRALFPDPSSYASGPSAPTTTAIDAE